MKRTLSELGLVIVETCVLGALAVTFPLAVGWSVNVPATFALAVVVVMALHVQHRLRPSPAMSRRHSEAQVGSQPFRRISLLRERFERGMRSPAEFNRLIAPLMRDLAADGLRRRGVDPDTQRLQARDALGEAAAELVFEPVTSVPTPAHVADALRRIEEL